MKRIFCDLCGESATNSYFRRYNSEEGTQCIAVSLQVRHQAQMCSTIGYVKLEPMGEGHICRSCLKELLEPLPISHAEGVDIADTRCPARINFFFPRQGKAWGHSVVSQCDYKEGHTGAHRASQLESKCSEHPTEITWDAMGSVTERKGQ